jgi:uncharacterized membrane protein
VIVAVNFIFAVARVLCMMELFSDVAWMCLSGGVLHGVFQNIMIICEVCLHAEGCHFEHLL